MIDYKEFLSKKKEYYEIKDYYDNMVLETVAKIKKYLHNNYYAIEYGYVEDIDYNESNINIHFFCSNDNDGFILLPLGLLNGSDEELKEFADKLVQRQKEEEAERLRQNKIQQLEEKEAEFERLRKELGK